MNIIDNNRTKNALISCFAVCKKVLVTGLAAVIAALSLLPVTTYAAGADKVEILVKVNREVIRLPDLYEHLTLNLRTSYKADGTDAVEVMNTRMSLLGSEPIPIGEYEMGKDIYVFFKITFDGPETQNGYQGSGVNTAYEFSSKSEKKLAGFKILGKQGNVFENMTNLNPGDVKEGVMHIESFTLKTPNPDEGDNSGDLPPTDDPTPVKPLIYLSGGLTFLLALQLIIFKKSKNRDKATETESNPV